MAFGPARLYHYGNRAGKVFTDEPDYLAHLENGWVDFPTKIREPKAVTITPPVEVAAAPEATPAPVLPDLAPIPKPKAKRPGRPAKKVKGDK